MRRAHGLDAADVAARLLRVLLVDGLQPAGRRLFRVGIRVRVRVRVRVGVRVRVRVRVYLAVQPVQVAHAKLQVRLCVGRVLLQRRAPRLLASGLEREPDGGGTPD